MDWREFIIDSISLNDSLNTLCTFYLQLAKKLAFSEEVQANVLEVKAIPGLGTTIDVVLVNGTLR